MMDFSEARSFNDGIEFYGKDIIIIATRKDDKVKIEKSKSPRLKYSNKFVKTIICLLLTIISNLILNTFQDFKVQILLIIALFWSSVICFFFFNSRNDKNVQCYKYHAAEHKFLNYIDKYKKEPETCEENEFIFLSVWFYNISSYYDFINFMYMWNFIYSYIDFKNLMDCL